MKRKILIQSWLFSCCFGIAVIFISGCSEQSPQKEFDAANAALQLAAVAEAVQYAPEEFKATQELMGKLTAEMGRKDYRAARQTALQTKEAAEKTRESAEAGKAKAKEAASTIANEVKQALEKIKGLFAKNAQLPAEHLQPLKDLFGAVETGASELDDMITNKRFKEALEKANLLKSQIPQIEQGLIEVRVKTEDTKKLPGSTPP